MANKRYIQRHKKYQKYANKELDEGRIPVKFKDYETEPVYFKGITKQSYESRMKQANEAKLRRRNRGK